MLLQNDGLFPAVVNPLVPSVPKNGTPILTVNREIIQALMG